MQALLDECVPAPLAKALGADWVKTTQSQGWASIKNGELIALAEKQFDIFTTSDQNIRYQQNLSHRSIAILLLPTNRWPILIHHIEEIKVALSSMSPKEYRVLSW